MIEKFAIPGVGGFIRKIEAGEESSEILEINGRKVLSYTPYSSSQNLEGDYPIMVQVFPMHITTLGKYCYSKKNK